MTTSEKKPRSTTSCAVVPEGAKVQVCVRRRKGRLGKGIQGPRDACAIIRGAASADRESFLAFYLDTKNRVLGVDEVHKGTVNGVEVHPREIFKPAVALNATAVIVAHNHPSGDPTPSDDDIILTRRLVEAGKMIGIPVLDHLIVAQEGCRSVGEFTADSLFGDAGKKAKRYPKLAPGSGAMVIAGVKKK